MSRESLLNPIRSTFTYTVILHRFLSSIYHYIYVITHPAIVGSVEKVLAPVNKPFMIILCYCSFVKVNLENPDVSN